MIHSNGVYLCMVVDNHGQSPTCCLESLLRWSARIWRNQELIAKLLGLQGSSIKLEGSFHMVVQVRTLFSDAICKCICTNNNHYMYTQVGTIMSLYNKRVPKQQSMVFFWSGEGIESPNSIAFSQEAYRRISIKAINTYVSMPKHTLKRWWTLYSTQVPMVTLFFQIS